MEVISVIFGWSLLLFAWGFPFILIFVKKRIQFGKSWNGTIKTKVSIAGKELRCIHCGFDKFAKREGVVTTSFLLLFHLAFLNRSARCYSCRNCGFLHWFVRNDEQAS